MGLDTNIPPSSSHGWRLDASYSRLPDSLFEIVEPATVQRPELVLFNHQLATELGLDGETLARPENIGPFAGNSVPTDSVPLAQAYSGHQFGYFTQLGDGRAVLLGEQITPDGRRFDIQLKGSGRTRYSRRGDGRAALGPMLREYVISEAMHALGVPSTRSLAVVKTGEPVFREDRLPGAVLTRVAASHLRVGTFEFVATQRDPNLLRTLADYALERHFPEHRGAEEPYIALLEGVIENQASLIARWMLVGFVHGVMNTDNVTLSGETIDYGPCAFMDAYDGHTVFSSIDQHGRYAYGQQPQIGHWNMARFAEALLPIIDGDQERAIEKAQESLALFGERFEHHWLEGIKAKLGFFTHEPEDPARISRFFEILQEQGSDFTNSFRDLSRARRPGDNPAFDEWMEDWRRRLERQPQDMSEILGSMRTHNPAVIPRNHRVEEALDAAARGEDFAPLHRLVDALADPFDHDEERPEYQEPAPPQDLPYRTFCGT